MRKFCQVLLTSKEIEDPMMNLRRVFRGGVYVFEFLDSKTMYKLNFLANEFKNRKLEIKNYVLIDNEIDSCLKLNVTFEFKNEGLCVEIYKNHFNESSDGFNLDYINYPVFIVDRASFQVIDFNINLVQILGLKINEFCNKSFFDLFSIQNGYDESSLKKDHIVRFKKDGRYFSIKKDFFLTTEFNFDVYILDSVDEYLKMYELNQEFIRNREKLRFKNSHVLRAFLANAIGISLIFKDPDLDKDEFVTLNETLLNSLNSLDKELRELIKESNFVG